MIEPSLPPTREEGFHSALLLPALPLLVFCLALFVPGLSAGFQILLVLHPLVFHLAHAPFVNSLIFLQTLSPYLCGFRAVNVCALTPNLLRGPCRDVRGNSPSPRVYSRGPSSRLTHCSRSVAAVHSKPCSFSKRSSSSARSPSLCISTA